MRVALAWLLCLSACAWQQYEEDPLREADLEVLRAERHGVLESLPRGADEGEAALDFATAAKLLRVRGPALRELLARYRTALVRAGIPAPLPNPALELGPEFGLGPDIDTRRVVPFVGLSWALPLSSRRGDLDAVHQAEAEAAAVAALARLHELYFELRARFVQLLVASSRTRLRERLLESTEQTRAAAERLAEAGAATALEVALFRLEEARERAHLLAARAARHGASAALAAMLALPATGLAPADPEAWPALPDELPALDLLRERALRVHPELRRGRAEYEVAERRLRLEIAKQWPDLVLGGSFAGETGENKTVLGLSLGLELPLFDRNEHAIAEARGRREELRAHYESTAHGVLSAVEAAHAELALVRARHRVLHDDVLEAAQTNVRVSRRSLEAGASGALQLLDAERSLREVEVELLEARDAELAAWSALERAVGLPFVRFAGEPRLGEAAWNDVQVWQSADGAGAREER